MLLDGTARKLSRLLVYMADLAMTMRVMMIRMILNLIQMKRNTKGKGDSVVFLAALE